MLVGVLSDSHGRVEPTRLAVAALRGRGAKLLIHLGDIGTEAVIDELVGTPCRIVFGNCDLDIGGLTRYAGLVEVQVDHPMGRVVIGGREIVYTHGDRPGLLEAAIRDGAAYLLHGHTHELRDERVGGTRVINPGALFRASRYTAALLDPGHDRLEVLEIGAAAR
jgi:putative phosphoesterase